MSRFDVRREAKLREIREIGPFVAASLCEVHRRCGYPACRCARGQFHQAFCLTYKLNNTTKTVHVPKDMIEEVKQWVSRYKRLKVLIREVSRNSIAIIHRYTPQKRAQARLEKVNPKAR